MEVAARPKKWGNSTGIIIPKEVADLEKIAEGDELIIQIEKKKDKERARLMKEGCIEILHSTGLLTGGGMRDMNNLCYVIPPESKIISYRLIPQQARCPARRASRISCSTPRGSA